MQKSLRAFTLSASNLKKESSFKIFEKLQKNQVCMAKDVGAFYIDGFVQFNVLDNYDCDSVHFGQIRCWSLDLGDWTRDFIL